MGLVVLRALVGASVVAMVASGAACSGGGAAQQGTGLPERTPSISTPSEPPPSGPSSPGTKDFANSLEFTRLVHASQHAQAGALVADNSAAARYVRYRLAYDKAAQLDGQDASADQGFTIDGDEKTGAINIDSEDGKQNYTWKDFTFDEQGKLTGWTGASGPIGSVLWSRESADSARGATARLLSAYRTNAGGMVMVVEWAATRKIQMNYGASYAAHGGYRQDATSQSFQDNLAKNEKTLMYYTFDGAKFGGKLRLAFYSGDDASELSLAIR